MEISMKDLAEKQGQLRADLAATNVALIAIATALTPEQRQHVLSTIARASAEKQQLCDRIPIAAMREATQQLQAAEERLYQAIQGAPSYLGD